ncbi:IS110 family transposase [Nocardia sp. CWNU-33]|uniref:IS110 family transposase n=1 Tax=Nocardia sp. CWNU-33 TaxID=3392117 RepID=UPI00398EEC55
MGLFCGIDWAEGHHDIAVVDRDGKLVSRKRISDDPTGFIVSELLADAGDIAEDPIPVAIETITDTAEITATATPQRCGTCSTTCSASSTTACKPAKPATPQRHSPHTRLHRRNPPQLDS